MSLRANLRRLLSMVTLILLAACTTPPGTPEIGPGYRDQSAPIGVTSRFDQKRFEGAWRVRAMIPSDEEIDAIALSDGARGLRMQVSAFVCDGAGICGNFAEVLPVQREGNGRFVLRLPNGKDRRMWVLWVDEGFRTAVVGNPEGTFAWILDRQRTGGVDRIRAAREILDFNGYDLGQLKVNK